MLERLRAQLAALLDQRAQLRDQQNAIITAVEARGADAALTADEQRTFDALVTQLRDLDTGQISPLEARLGDLAAQAERDARAELLRATQNEHRERPAGGARVTREERTYTRHKDMRNEASWFCDMYRSHELGDRQAEERLRRHGQEMVVERELSLRAQSTGGAAGLVVPIFLPNLFAAMLRAGRPFANTLNGLDLPAEGMTVTIPRATTGAAVASQATENTAVQNTDEQITNLTFPVITIAGQQDVSRQLLERGAPGYDQLMYQELAAAYHAELDRQCLNGLGTGNTHTGIFQLSGVTQSQAYGAALTAANFTAKVAGGIGAIAGAGSIVQPNLIVMHTRRWAWLNSLSDSQGRPLTVPSVGGPMNVLAYNAVPGGYSGDGEPTELTLQSVGSIQGIPVFTDTNVPTAVGTNSEDLVGFADRTKILLWEDGDKQPKNLRFEQTLGNQLTVKVVVYGYSAFSAGRYPTAAAKLGGVDSTAGQGQINPNLF